MDSIPVIAVLMSTYNGQLYLEQQIDSLLKQTQNNFTLYIRDDGSTDDTVKIIENYVDKFHNVVFLKDSINLGAAGSFLSLQNEVDADYYFFCDQDDVWLPNKIEDTLKSFEGKDESKPIIAHTDLIIVDERLNYLSESFYDYSNISINEFKNKKQILLQNYIVGCTSCINRALAKISRINRAEVESIAMHDWWYTLNATYFGEVIYIDKATIMYRQHNNNTLGANKDSLGRYVKLFISGEGIKRVNRYRNKLVKQSKFFAMKNIDLISHEDRLPFQDIYLLDDRSSIIDVLRFFVCKKNSLKSFKRNLAFIISSIFY
ncbi:glycosyltransferase family 2 protein [Buttiauxella warmboldiae]|uniref:Glycosyltransferase family 2 protein n=1 Tax=Buttiauxella warmboldiae TaxID=82993 RepID=A0A3N5DLG5_9ENTR|nr:glycosyltransferase family 2 protein [Buttiauxella warmboldiae]RPH28131.1 glycosyltransferase family 2 protein [Buttiauxella warmboldiae]